MKQFLLLQGFTISISPLDGEADPDLSEAATFEYDAVNQRVRLMLCFPRPGVFRAALSYDGELLQHGDFHCIVLTGTVFYTHLTSVLTLLYRVYNGRCTTTIF